MGVVDDRLVEQGRRVHHAEGVLEASMHGAGIHLVGPGQLADAPQPLEGGLLDDVSFPFGELDEPMHRAPDLVGAMWICHCLLPSSYHDARLKSNLCFDYWFV